jgi:putative ABC transport system permease protein
MPVAAAWWSDALSGITAYRNPRFQTVVLGSFAGLALLLTATGIFGVVAFIAAARTKEMGIRIAIGARPASLVAMMLRQTSIPVAIGIAGGLVASRWMSRLAEAQLFQVDARDPIMLAAAAATVIATALAAAYLPARRASQVDPIEVLRAE